MQGLRAWWQWDTTTPLGSASAEVMSVQAANEIAVHRRHSWEALASFSMNEEAVLYSSTGRV